VYVVVQHFIYTLTIAVSPNDKAIIRAKLGDGWYFVWGESLVVNSTVEVLSDSTTELVISIKGFDDRNVLISQYDCTYEKAQ